MRKLMFGSVLVLAAAVLANTASPQQDRAFLTMDKVMTPEEMRETGVANLSAAQRRALDRWLVRYTQSVLRTVGARREGVANCTPAIETNISGEFNGWDGETVFKLDNGQIWQQAEYDYMYEYSYRPEVTIYSTSSGCRMKVEDVNETILVRRIK